MKLTNIYHMSESQKILCSENNLDPKVNTGYSTYKKFKKEQNQI